MIRPSVRLALCYYSEVVSVIVVAVAVDVLLVVVAVVVVGRLSNVTFTFTKSTLT